MLCLESPNNIALYGHAMLVNKQQLYKSIYTLALGSLIPSPSKWISHMRDPIFTSQKLSEPNNYTELTELL